jgi:hypothetical protein
MENSMNAVFALLCVAIGAGAAVLAGSLRHAVGVAAAVLAILVAHFGAGWVYRVDVSDGEFVDALEFLLIPAFLGLLGGHLSRYLAPTA